MFKGTKKKLEDKNKLEVGLFFLKRFFLLWVFVGGSITALTGAAVHFDGVKEALPHNVKVLLWSDISSKYRKTPKEK